MFLLVIEIVSGTQKKLIYESLRFQFPSKFTVIMTLKHFRNPKNKYFI